MAYRTVDARGIWQGDSKALDRFALAYAFDCGGSDELWHRVYGWTPEALAQAKSRAFGAYQETPDTVCQ